MSSSCRCCFALTPCARGRPCAFPSLRARNVRRRDAAAHTCHSLSLSLKSEHFSVLFVRRRFQSCRANPRQAASLSRRGQTRGLLEPVSVSCTGGRRTSAFFLSATETNPHGFALTTHLSTGCATPSLPAWRWEGGGVCALCCSLGRGAICV